jgi:hypothetical protein
MAVLVHPHTKILKLWDKGNLLLIFKAPAYLFKAKGFGVGVNYLNNIAFLKQLVNIGFRY